MKSKDTLLDQQQLQNPIESGPVEPNLRAKRRRRRKKFFTVSNGSPSLAKNRHTNLTMLALKCDRRSIGDEENGSSRLDAHSGSGLTMREEVVWRFDGKGWAYE
ncbi:uncharacterized protein LOC125476745 isoform X2 [Pyrus x bretschneideri]|uniref:uncharacterized protein LOC125476745 isoform X1 n=1 Tax=Pyrus x bretschneideri TaxID=225117 RepID=UPI00202FD5D5|nr:uncharacterized protein LOC125476745 isoform X1 [Pyrus x bretschneideri]XP_048439153.1 uncharacterized protein LOC125476745 isoform X2 [Pyrus x bretschneideri]